MSRIRMSSRNTAGRRRSIFAPMPNADGAPSRGRGAQIGRPSASRGGNAAAKRLPRLIVAAIFAFFWLFYDSFAALQVYAAANAGQPSQNGTAGPSADLQRLIDQAAEGDIVVVPEGVYAGPIRIAKPIELRAAADARVTVVNNSEFPALSIEADDAAAIGLVIEDAGVKEAPFVLVTGDRVRLRALRVTTGSDGIKLDGSDGSEVSDCVVEWGAGEQYTFAQRGNGIDLYQSHGVRIAGNVVRGVFDGIYMEFSDDTIVTDNHIERSRYGIHCMYTNRTIIRDNTGTMNITGGMIMAVKGVELTNNTFTKQTENVNSQGILLFDAHESVIAENRVEGNRVGVYVEQSSENELFNNAVVNNFIGIQLIDSSRNAIVGNSFVGNVTDAMARGNSDNDIKSNYWDSFSGIDLDGDGRSDTTYAINPFFQGLIQKKPAFQLFFQAPGIAFLESLYEAGRAGWTTDQAPLMAPPEKWAENPEDASDVAGWLSIFLVAGAVLIIFVFRRKIV